MRILRTVFLGVAGLVAIAGLSVSLNAGGQAPAMPAGTHQMPMTGKGMPAKAMTKEQKIANAMTAAPSSIASRATVLDWPAKDGDTPPVLRTGGNGWTCLPDMPQTDGNDPMCVDQAWMKWIDAYIAHKTPQITNVGIGYMIAPGGAYASNTDPYAMAASHDNHWMLHQPHIMIVVPDTKTLDSLPTDPNNGGPYVMFKGTPYVHVMAPLSAPVTPTRSAK